MPAPVLCLYRYKEGSIFGFNESYVFNSQIEESESVICIRFFLFNMYVVDTVVQILYPVDSATRYNLCK